MGKKAKKRRQSHGSAWLWKQTDCWYYTEPGTKKRVALFDENGEPIRGKVNREAAEVALAREKLTWGEDAGGSGGGGEWIVARVCSEYLQYCERGVIAIVLAAFNRADEMFGITNPIKGLKKPKSEPRLASIKPEEEQALYGATEPCFGNFLFAAIHTVGTV